MKELHGKRIVVTGGAGFLGSHVVQLLQACRANVFVPRSKDFDLVNKDSVWAMFNNYRPDIVVHLAAQCGGIGINQKNPGKFLHDNLMMGANIVEVSRFLGIEKLVLLGTVCSYPKFTPVPFKEKALWNGYPEETNAPYGIAKKTVMEMGRAYRAQYGLNVISLIPVNLFGPHDNFNPESSHVIPALIRKFLIAKKKSEKKVIAWGTGRVSREFLYVEDCARAIVSATAFYNEAEPVNIGAGKEITIRELTELIKNTVGYDGEVIWDNSKPDGQPRRCLDTSKAAIKFGFRNHTDFETGIIKTVEWANANIDLD